MDLRQEELTKWLKTHPSYQDFSLTPLDNDASFRRYFRVQTPDSSFIAMDAPPHLEKCQPFIAISNALRELGLETPAIHLSDLERGFLLLTDFGPKRLLDELSLENASLLYGKAINALAMLQTCNKVEGWSLPFFTTDFMRQELGLFKEWFLENYLGLEFSSTRSKQLLAVFDFLATSAAKQPQVFMHRDYHSANLMVLPSYEIGILDFQDAFKGPITYDLVSLLRDCYIDWPEELVTQHVFNYKYKLKLDSISNDEFYRWFDLMGIQRHLKALLTFARKFKRDQNANYLKHIPRTLHYILQVSLRYPECLPLYQLMHDQVASACVE